MRTKNRQLQLNTAHVAWLICMLIPHFETNVAKQSASHDEHRCLRKIPLKAFNYTTEQLQLDTNQMQYAKPKASQKLHDALCAKFGITETAFIRLIKDTKCTNYALIEDAFKSTLTSLENPILNAGFSASQILVAEITARVTPVSPVDSEHCTQN